MKELTERKKLQILKLFLEGYSYDQISTEAAVGKGTVVNVVKDFQAGHFPAFTDVAELVDVLRELSVELRRRGGGVSEALLGNAFFFRLNEMGVTPDKLWLWEAMCREMSSSEEHLQEFTDAALELFRLSQETGESYNSIAVKWSELHTESKSLEQEMEGLKSAKEELETTQATLTKDVQRLMEEKGALGRAVAELSTRHEALKTESIDIETRCQVVKTEVEQLQAKSTILGPVVERLDALGFCESELETLRVKLDGFASGHGLTSEQLTVRFFDDLANYGDLLSFEKKKEELEGEVARLEAQKESLQKVTSRLGVPPHEVEEAVRSLTSLKKRGIMPSVVASYYRVLSQAEVGPDELEGEVLKLGDLKKAITSSTESLKRLKEKEDQRTKVVEALRAEEAGVKAAIQELTAWGQRVIEETQEKALTAVEQATQRMAREIKEWGDSRAELGAYLDDLKRARYFTRLPLSDEALENYIQDMSPFVVTQGLQMVLFWCLRKLNLKSRPPRWVVRKYYSIGEYTDVELTDLVRWSLEAFTEGVGGNEKRA